MSTRRWGAGCCSITGSMSRCYCRSVSRGDAAAEEKQMGRYSSMILDRDRAFNVNMMKELLTDR